MWWNPRGKLIISFIVNLCIQVLNSCNLQVDANLVFINLEQYASGKKFQEILEESIVKPLKIDGELYIGIPPGK